MCLRGCGCFSLLLVWEMCTSASKPCVVTSLSSPIPWQSSPDNSKPSDDSICFCQVVQTPFQSVSSQCLMAASLWPRNNYCVGGWEGVTERSWNWKTREICFFQKKISQAQIISFVRLLPWIEVDVVQAAVVYIIFSLIPYCEGQTSHRRLFGIGWVSSQ